MRGMKITAKSFRDIFVFRLSLLAAPACRRLAAVRHMLSSRSGGSSPFSPHSWASDLQGFQSARFAQIAFFLKRRLAHFDVLPDAMSDV